MRFLYKTFIKDYQNINDASVRARYGIFAGIVGVICNIFLSIIKLVIGILVNSISLIGDAFNNLADTCSSFVNVFSFKINSKPADKEHPYGHRRSEYIGGLIISILIITVSIELFTSSVNKIINPTFTTVSWYILLVLIINIIVKIFMALLYNNSSKKIKSLSLKASYKDSLNDIITTCIVVLGLYVSLWFNIDLDGYLGIGLSIFIAISAIQLIRESINKLLGESLDEDTTNRIILYITNENNINSIHDVLTHQYGIGKSYMSLHVEMDASLSLLEAHNIIDKLERNVKAKYGVELLIHIDPVDYSNSELIKIKDMVNNILNQIDTNLSSHDIRLVDDSRIYFDLVMPYSYQDKSKEIIDIVVNEISRYYKYKVSIEINYK